TYVLWLAARAGAPAAMTTKHSTAAPRRIRTMGERTYSRARRFPISSVGRGNQIRAGSKAGAAERARRAPAPARIAAPAQAAVNGSRPAAAPNASGPGPFPTGRPSKPRPAPAPGVEGLARTRVRNRRPVHPHPPANAPTAPRTRSGTEPIDASAMDTAPVAIITQM